MKEKKLSLGLLIALVGFPQISETIYTPALPMVAAGLQTSAQLVEETLVRDGIKDVNVIEERLRGVIAGKSLSSHAIRIAHGNIRREIAGEILLRGQPSSNQRRDEFRQWVSVLEESRALAGEYFSRLKKSGLIEDYARVTGVACAAVETQEKDLDHSARQLRQIENYLAKEPLIRYLGNPDDPKIDPLFRDVLPELAALYKATERVHCMFSKERIKTSPAR